MTTIENIQNILFKTRMNIIICQNVRTVYIHKYCVCLSQFKCRIIFVLTYYGVMSNFIGLHQFNILSQLNESSS